MESLNKNVLIVDDEELILNALKRVLRKEGLFIITANTGSEAIKIFKNFEISVIVSDYKMPGMNGIELLEEVKKISSKTIRILITASSEIEEDFASQYDVISIIKKPWYNIKLKSTILSAVNTYNSHKCQKI